MQALNYELNITIRDVAAYAGVSVTTVSYVLNNNPLTKPATRLSKLSRSVEGKVVLVTGAASGMGRATAHLFADDHSAAMAAALGAMGRPETLATLYRCGVSLRQMRRRFALPVVVRANQSRVEPTGFRPGAAGS